MKKYFIYSAALLALVSSCQSDDFLGNTPGNVQTSGNETAINFAGGTGKITRANVKNGEDAANLLKKHFVVYGDKTTGSTTQKVYDHYDVKWIGKADANKTQSNKEGWEYVGLTPNKNSSLANGATQTIKYWDYSASEYNFAAFSMGDLTPETGETYDNQVDKDAATIESGKVKISQIDSKATKYTIEGSADNIAKLYISDRVTAKPSGATPGIKYKDAVQFTFRALKSQVRMGIFETVPGYSVKDVKFYSSNPSADPATTPGLYATTTSIPAGDGTATVTFGTSTTDGSYNKAKIEWTASNNVKDITFENLTLTGVDSKEDAGATNQYIGRTAKEASFTKEYKTVIPSAKIGALTLKVDYTLVSTDGSKEEIKVTGATATVPSEYTQWQPNYSYTYIFKISDKTNGTTGKPGDTPGLYPIYFDAVVTETSEGIQNTITTVEDASSITTYAKGNEIGTEYKINDNIYACVINKTSGKTIDLYTKTTDTEGNDTFTYHAKLYKLSGTTESITEAEAKAILDNNNKTLGGKTLSEVGTYGTNTKDSQFVDQIDADDAVDGVAVKGKFFKFTPTKTTDAGTYVFAYVNGDTKSYKVIKVAAN